MSRLATHSFGLLHFNYIYMPDLLQRQLRFLIVTDQAGHIEDGMQWPAALALPLILDL